MKLTVLIVFVAALLGVEVWQVTTSTSSTFQKWEYIIESPKDEDLSKRLNTLGMDGWEIVSARRATSEIDGKSVAAYEMIFRRPAQPVARLRDGQLPDVPAR